MQRITIHIGHGKTGTSAIQNFLANNIKILNDSGIEYPYHDSFERAKSGCITSGNLHYSKNWLTEQVISKSSDSIGFPRVLFSNENIFHHVEAEIPNFVDYKDKFSFEIILFVRDPVSMMLSGYQQAIKSQGYYGSLEEYSAKEIHISKSRRIVEACITHGVPIQLRNYNTHKSTIVKSFLECLQVGHLFDTQKTSAPIVNRSLSPAETLLLKHLNQLSDGVVDRDLCQALMAGTESTPNDCLDINEDIFSALHRRTKDDVECLNEFLDGDYIKFTNWRDFSTTHNVGGQYIMTESQIESIANHIHEIRKKFSNFDFDPVRYLELNPKLRDAGVDPYKHFLIYGQKEGRKY